MIDDFDWSNWQSYLVLFIVALTYVGAVIICLWSLVTIYLFMFGDIVEHHLKIKEAKMKWRKAK